MAYTADDLGLAQRHVREGEGRIERQKALIVQLTRDGNSTLLARQLLDGFEGTLGQMRIHLAAIEADVALKRPGC